jgi:hypothetical protein
VALLDFNWRRSDRPVPSHSIKWKVIHLDGPLTKQIGLDIEYGVVISSDMMLEKTQTLLFCPLIDGLDKEGMLLAKLPWHVEVRIAESTNQARVPYSRKLLSTKIVLPTALNEIDRDGRERGRLSSESQHEVARVLRKWMPMLR